LISSSERQASAGIVVDRPGHRRRAFAKHGRSSAATSAARVTSRRQFDDASYHLELRSVIAPKTSYAQMQDTEVDAATVTKQSLKLASVGMPNTISGRTPGLPRC
jgi:hypothetical protein